MGRPSAEICVLCQKHHTRSRLIQAGTYHVVCPHCQRQLPAIRSAVGVNGHLLLPLSIFRCLLPAKIPVKELRRALKEIGARQHFLPKANPPREIRRAEAIRITATVISRSRCRDLLGCYGLSVREFADRQGMGVAEVRHLCRIGEIEYHRHGPSICIPRPVAARYQPYVSACKFARRGGLNVDLVQNFCRIKGVPRDKRGRFKVTSTVRREILRNLEGIPLLEAARRLKIPYGTLFCALTRHPEVEVLRRGRIASLSPEVFQRIRSELRTGLTQQQVAGLAGVSQAEVSLLVQRDLIKPRPALFKGKEYTRQTVRDIKRLKAKGMIRPYQPKKKAAA